MNGYLLLADQADKIVIMGKNPITAKTAIKPTSKSATTQPPGATGINETNAAAVPTNRIGATQNSGLSALAGMIISFEINLRPSAANCNRPSIFPQ